ncbi:MAG: hypothetical protein QJR01_02720 [Kyrpidia sp.]|nr:hypothetical protein [Kyrpidia sp.]
MIGDYDKMVGMLRIEVLIAMIISEEAKAHILAMQKTEDRPWTGLRLQVLPGCGGLRFILSPDDTRSGDTCVEVSGLRVMADPFASTFLDKLTVEYSAADGDLVIHRPGDPAADR